jgi:Protein of unknown function (DUF3667)
MKHRRKNDQCPNCGLAHPPLYNYCPQCGQENTTSKVSFSALLSDLFSNYLTFDSRTGRTVGPFLFQPGKLTLAFNRGQRLRYLHPVRLYILMNLFFFFVFGRSVSVDSLSLDQWLEADETNVAQVVNQGLDQGDSILTKELQGALTDNLPKGMANQIAGQVAANLPKPRLKQVQHKKSGDSTLVQGKAGAKPASWLKVENKSEVRNITKFIRFIQNKKTTPDALLDSLALIGIRVHGLGVESAKPLATQPTPVVARGDRDAFSLVVARQLLKIGQRDLPLFVLNVIGNIPAMMLFMLPLLALSLKLLYVRRKFYFIEHFIFSLHLQSFIYLVFGLALLGWQAFAKWHLDLSIEFLVASQVILLVYHLAMFRRAYGQGWFKTIFKASMFTFFYFTTLSFFFILELAYSFWAF